MQAILQWCALPNAVFPLHDPQSIVAQVYTCVDGEWVVDAEHVAMLDDRWDLDVVRDAAYAALAAVGKDHMHFRPPDEQNEHKVSIRYMTQEAEARGA